MSLRHSPTTRTHEHETEKELKARVADSKKQRIISQNAQMIRMVKFGTEEYDPWTTTTVI